MQRWYYTLTDGKDYLVEREEGYYLGRDDIDLGPADEDVEGLLLKGGFSPSNIIRLLKTMGSNRRETEMAEKRPCPECGKNLTWVADGSRPRQHKCEPPPGFRPEPEPQKPASSGLNLAVIMEKYISNRDQISAEKKVFDEKVAQLKTQQAAMEKWFAGKLDEMGVTKAAQTGIGTVFFKKRSSATVADAQQFTDWVLDDWDGRNHFMERRVSKVAVDDWVEEGNDLPAGTNYSTTRVVQINRN